MKKLSRILILDHARTVGGAEQYMLDLVENTDRNQVYHVVAAASPELKDRLKKNNLECVVLDSKRLRTANPATALWRMCKTLNDIRRIVSRRQIEIVVTNTVRMHIVGVLFRLLFGRRLVWIVHSYDFNLILFRVLSGVPDRILFVSESLFESYWGNRKGRAKCEVIYNGISREKIRRNERNDEFGITAIAGKKAGIIGRIEREKGHEDFIKSIPLILQLMPDVHFFVIGRPDPSKTVFTENLVQMTRVLNIENNVHFLGYTQDIFSLIDHLDVVVQPSRIHESFGRVLVESMAIGKPVVATRVKGYTEIIKDGFNGILVPVESPADIAKAVTKVLNDKEYRERIVENGKNFIRSRYCLEDSTGKYLSVMRAIQ